ncbi:MAG: HAD family hydrolase [Acidimicrobiia bacterium]
MRDVSIVATDLDGTLLRSDRTVSERTRASLRAASAAGITVIVVTARPPRWLDDIAGLHLHGYAICANGAVVVDLATGTHIERFALSRDVVVDVSDAIRDGLPDVVFALETGVGFGHEPAYLSDWPTPPGTQVGDVATLVDVLDEPVKLLVRHAELGAHSLEALREITAGRCSISFSGGAGLIEIAPFGIDKGTSLARLVAGLGRDATHVVAVGDMPNDLPMLRWAGHAAAVANAHPDLLAIADTILPSNDDDGVAHLIESLLPGDDDRR